MAELITLLAPVVTGPYGALALSVLLLFGVYRTVDKHVIPMAKEWLRKRDDHIEALMKSHKEDRNAFTSAISTLSDKLGMVEAKVDGIADDVDAIREALK